MSDERGNYILQPTKQEGFVLSLKTKETREFAIPKEL